MVITINGTITTTVDNNSDFTAAIAAVQPSFNTISGLSASQKQIAVQSYMGTKRSPQSMNGGAFRD